MRALTRVRLLTILAAVVAAIAVAGALAVSLRGGDGTPAGPVGPGGPSFTEGVIGTWRRINPLLATTEVDRDLCQLVFAGLVRIGADGSVEPGLADLPEVAAGGRLLTFRLRDGLRWSDGTALTAEDVAFTIELIEAPDFRGDPELAAAWSGVAVTVRDSSTVEVLLPQPNAAFVARFATVGILPRHILGSVTAPALVDHPFNASPVGAGPYTIRAIDPTSVHLVPNALYAGDIPRIADLRLRFFADQPSAVAAFVAREVDGLLTREPLSEVEEAAVAELAWADRRFVRRSVSLLLYLNNDSTLFDDPSVRRALTLVLDRRAFAVNANQVPEAISASPIVPGSWAYSAEFDQQAQDVREAKRLLEEAGWTPNGTTGVLTRTGSEFRITIRTDDDPMRIAVASELSRQLQVLGIRATVATTSFAVLMRDFLQERTYEAAVVAWDQGPDPDPYDGWHSSQMGSAGLNLANFADPVIDGLIALGRTRPEREVRMDAYRQFQERWLELTPSLVLGYPSLTYLLDRSVRPSLPDVLFSLPLRFSDIEHWQR